MYCLSFFNRFRVRHKGLKFLPAKLIPGPAGLKTKLEQTESPSTLPFSSYILLTLSFPHLGYVHDDRSIKCERDQTAWYSEKRLS